MAKTKMATPQQSKKVRSRVILFVSTLLLIFGSLVAVAAPTTVMPEAGGLTCNFVWEDQGTDTLGKLCKGASSDHLRLALIAVAFFVVGFVTSLLKVTQGTSNLLRNICVPVLWFVGAAFVLIILT